jgi:hypothetical protein
MTSQAGHLLRIPKCHLDLDLWGFFVCEGALIGNCLDWGTRLLLLLAVVVEGMLDWGAPGGGVPLIGAIGNATPLAEALDDDLSLVANNEIVGNDIYLRAMRILPCI